jgi:hypothetical protein
MLVGDHWPFVCWGLSGFGTKAVSGGGGGGAIEVKPPRQVGYVPCSGLEGSNDEFTAFKYVRMDQALRVWPLGGGSREGNEVEPP